MTYDELINNLKVVGDKQLQVDELFKFLLKSVQYDYPTIESWKCDYKLVDYIDSTFNPADVSDKQKVYQLLKKEGFSNEFASRVIKHYGEQFVVPAKPERVIMGKLNPAVAEHVEYRKFSNALNMFLPEVVYKDGIITKGVCADFSEFIKRVCDDLHISCHRIEGTTPIAHVWNLIDAGNGLKHYDLTYAIYDRDNGAGNINASKWLGKTTEELLAIHPTRKIDHGSIKNKYKA